MGYYTQATKRAVQKYNKNHYDRIEIKGQKGVREMLNLAAQSAGQSVNLYIWQAINERMQRDGFRPSNVSDVTVEALEDETPPT